MKKPTGILRDGYTTGSAAAAAAVAAYRQSTAPVRLRLPDSAVLDIPVHSIRPGGATVIKDGGDDPDVTTGAEIRVDLAPDDGAAAAADHREVSDTLTLTIQGGDGVGRVTRPGLAVKPGKAAINPTPRRMMLDNLVLAGCAGHWRAVISVPGGAAIAARTLNPTLGIEGGISILGNSGIVRPYSNAAYAATIVLQLNGVAAAGGNTAALVTGNRSAAAVARDFPALPPEAIIRIGDFIHVAITAARRARLERLIVGCMPGKLFKYACAERNTHAHQSKLTPVRMREFGVELPEIELETVDTMGELAARLDPARYRTVVTQIYQQAHRVLQRWAGTTGIEIVLYDDTGRRM